MKEDQAVESIFNIAKLMCKNDPLLSQNIIVVALEGLFKVFKKKSVDKYLNLLEKVLLIKD